MDLRECGPFAFDGDFSKLSSGSGLALVDLNECNSLGGPLTANFVAFVTSVREKHGLDAVRLNGCGDFTLAPCMLDPATIPKPRVDLQDVGSLGGDISRAVLDRMLDATMRPREGSGPFELPKDAFTKFEQEVGLAQKYFEGRTWLKDTKVR